MAANIKTIDARIRAKAQQEHRDAIKALFLPVWRMANSSNTTVMSGLHEKGQNETTCCHALDVIEAAVFAATVGKAEERAVAAFLERVDALANEVDELREAVAER